MREQPKPGRGLSERQLNLAHLIAEGHSLREAYRLAGYESVGGVYSPNSIVQNADFKFYLFHLREVAQERTYQTVELLVKQLDDARLLALVERDPGAVVQAVMAKAKLLGIVGDKGDLEPAISRPSRRPTTTVDLSVEEWQKTFEPKRIQ